MIKFESIIGNVVNTILLRGAQAAGYPTDLWTTARIAEIIWKRFKIRYHADHVGRLLHDLGYSCHKPVLQAREHEALAERQWRKQEWPRLKKGRKTAS